MSSKDEKLFNKLASINVRTNALIEERNKIINKMEVLKEIGGEDVKDKLSYLVLELHNNMSNMKSLDEEIRDAYKEWAGVI